MKIKTIKKMTALFLSLVMVFSIIPFGYVTAYSDDEDDDDDEYYEEDTIIENEYLQFAVNGYTYVMHTTGGNPAIDSDDEQRLLFGDMDEGTSLTVVKVGDEEFLFDPDESMLNEDEDTIYSVEEFDDEVRIERYCTFVMNTETERKDTLEMKYVFTNLSEEDQEIGTRIMLDTMLGDNDDAPFRLYENNELIDVNHEVEYTGENIPQHWYVFDSLSDPTVLGSGTFYSNELEKPDKVQFILWPEADNDSYENTITGEDFGDSAVNIYYDPITLASGESRTVSTYYGISEFAPVENDEEAEIRLTNAIAPHTLVPLDDETDYRSNPFQFSAWISNTGDADSDEVTATLVLPDELTIDDQSAQISLGEIEAGSYRSVGWMIRALQQEFDTEVNYSVIVSVEGEEDLIYDFTIELPALNPVHEHTLGAWITDTEASCTEEGYIYRLCTVCGEVVEERFIPAFGHNFTEVIEIVEPTYTDEGYTVYGCSRHCGETENRDFTDVLVSNAKIVISNETSQPNREVTVTLTLQDAIPVKSLMFYEFEYDEDILELVNASFVHEGAVIENWNPSRGEAVLTFPENTDANGVVLELTFRVKNVDNVTSDISCNVAATYAKGGSVDLDVPVAVVDGSVTVFSGDINGDGVLNTLDVIYLLKHTLLPERYPLYCDADFDNDGVVTSNDAIYLLSHILFPDRYPLGGR